MNFFKLITSIVVCELAGTLGSIFTMSQITTWYATLNKPTLNPPAWIFAPVWTTLYFLMGVSAYLIWNKGLDRKDVKIALIVFGIQLALNVLWSIFFFGIHNPALAFLDIVLLWISILSTIFIFYKISPTAAYLLVPYIIWVSFASYLNYSIWVLN